MGLDQDDHAVPRVTDVERPDGHAVRERPLHEGKRLVAAVAPTLVLILAGSAPLHLRIEHLRGGRDVPAGKGLPCLAEQRDVAFGHGPSVAPLTGPRTLRLGAA